MKVKRVRGKPSRCRPGSIEQELDMCESGPFRGDEISRHEQHRDPFPKFEEDEPMPDEAGMQENFHIDMSEDNREGDEMSGDEHSGGLQGGDPDLEGQETIDTGLPGEETKKGEAREKKSAA